MELDPNQDIIDRLMGSAPRCISYRQTNKASYAHVLTEDRRHLWRCRLQPDYADTPEGLQHMMHMDFEIQDFETLDEFINKLGIEE